jgi:MYXO-CTERM domain-containing protein
MVGMKGTVVRSIWGLGSLLALLLFDQRAFAAPRLSVGPSLAVEDAAPVPIAARFGGAAFDGQHWLVVLDESEPAATWLATDGSRTGEPFPILDQSSFSHHLVFDGEQFVLASLRLLEGGRLRQELHRFSDPSNLGPAIAGIQEEGVGADYHLLQAHDLAPAPDGSVWTVACTELSAAATSECVVAVLDGDALVPHATISLAYDLRAVELEPNGNGALLFTESVHGGIRAYRLAADGTFAEPTLIAADGAVQSHTTLSAARSAAGYAVAWAEDGALGLARLDGDGQLVATKLGTATSVQTPTLGPAPDGYVLALAEGEPASGNFEVLIKALDAELEPRGSTVQLQDRSRFSVGLSAAQPGVMVAWSSTQSEALRAAVLNPTSLAPQGPTPVDLSVNEQDQSSLRAARAGKSWLVAWMEMDHGVRARLFDETAKARGDSFALPASAAPDQLCGGTTGWLLSWSLSPDTYEALLIDLDGAVSNSFTLPGPAAFAPLEDGWLALRLDNQPNRQLLVDRYDQRGQRLSRSVVAETTDSRQGFEKISLAKTENGFVAVWGMYTQYDPQIEREVSFRRLDGRGEPVGAVELVVRDIFGPGPTGVAATNDAVWLLLNQNSTQYGVYFSPFPLKTPLQPLTERWSFAELQAVSGHALGAWNIPGEDHSHIGLAKPGAAMIEQGEVPFTLSDISLPTPDAEKPHGATLMVAGTVTSRRLGASVNLGRIALLHVEDDGEADGGAPGQPMAGEAGQPTVDDGGESTVGDGGESTTGEASMAGERGQPPPGHGQPTTGSGGEDAAPDVVLGRDEHGCGCHLADNSPGNAAAWSLLLLAGALSRRRRRSGAAARQCRFR